jgi:hypothetical protein
MNTKKAVYIGAGTDAEMFVLGIQTMICIDSQPKNECPMDPNHRLFDASVFPMFRRDFLDRLVVEYKSKGFECVSTDTINSCLTFRNQQQVVRYYYSIAFPYELNNHIETDIANYDVLICDGYLPHKRILEYASDSFQFIGSNQSCYLHPDTDDQFDKADLVDYELERDSSKVGSWLGLCRTYQGRIIDTRKMSGIEGFRGMTMFAEYSYDELDDELDIS